MKLRLLTVGKPRDRESMVLHDRYAARLARLGLAYKTDWVREVPVDGKYTDEHVREREAALLVGKLTERGHSVALDPAGRPLDTPALKDRIASWAPRGLTLVIGGPTGLHANVLDRVDESWSLSPMTFPHELVRVIVAEQIYRAMTMIKGLPYHK